MMLEKLRDKPNKRVVTAMPVAPVRITGRRPTVSLCDLSTVNTACEHRLTGNPTPGINSKQLGDCESALLLKTFSISTIQVHDAPTTSPL
jgi:hypothetical protein